VIGQVEFATLPAGHPAISGTVHVAMERRLVDNADHQDGPPDPTS